MAGPNGEGWTSDGVEAAPAGEASTRCLILLGLLVAFTFLTFQAVSSGSPSDVRQRPRLLTTMATITGPFAGAVARDGQSCCLAFSTWLAAWLAPALAIGVLSQFMLSGATAAGRGLRLSLWTLGWFLWLAGGSVSFMHALN